MLHLRVLAFTYDADDGFLTGHVTSSGQGLGLERLLKLLPIVVDDLIPSKLYVRIYAITFGVKLLLNTAK